MSLFDTLRSKFPGSPPIPACRFHDAPTPYARVVSPMTALAQDPPSPYLRHWQIRALQRYDEAHARDFLVTATPGSGKTTFALTLAGRLLAQRVVHRVIVVVPTALVASNQ